MNAQFDTDGDAVLLTPRFAEDPYALYALLRTQRPVTKVQVPGGPPAWLVTRYEDVRAGLADRRLSKDITAALDDLRAAGAGVAAVTLDDFDAHDHMLNSDPPKHTRLRKLVTKAFTTRAVAGLRPRIQELAEELVDALAKRLADGERSVDLIDALAFPLPMKVICEILGVPEDRRTAFRKWSHAVLSPASPAEFVTASAEMTEYLSVLVAEKRERPGEDILSAIVAADEHGDRLSDSEATGMASLLLVAGHETTMNLIGNGVLALLKDRAQWDRLRREPALLTGAVEEFLRIDSPVNTATVRFATEPVTIGATTVLPGSTVLLAIGSANRDPEVFERPDEIDLQRPRGKSLAFGHGIHYCLGAALARMEGEIAFRVLADRLPTLALAVEPGSLNWQSSLLIRGLTELPVRA
ncbi:cytochrome P450 [Amycolatopsis sp. BJA-103]|uniref:cytochrome P450 family protein n=1 Tax=Amycolatopsis sp. BJA-103 TaxID=1911175 RepID=UPI000C77CA0F|nr:cytochrome P450 [Amycolatopsis sp. BJA-103]AUI58402.1 cytochrome [Amycolatopsis sp. BJA-103]PNE13394.1 cytochrome [Amycolatopsis sp. BJA-103]